MDPRQRQAIERRIARVVVEDLIKAGYKIDVYDGEGTPLKGSRSVFEILRAMFTTDEDRLFVSRPSHDTPCGWVQFIYGNDGIDVIQDNTVNLESCLMRAQQLADAIETGTDFA